MTLLTVEQRKLLNENGAASLRLLDPDTRREYVLLHAEIYDQLRSTLGDIEPRDVDPSLHRALRDEGRDDPHMDEYG